MIMSLLRNPKMHIVMMFWGAFLTLQAAQSGDVIGTAVLSFVTVGILFLVWGNYREARGK